MNQNIAQFWLSYIDALIKLNRMDDAKAVFDQSKSNGLQGEGFNQIEQRSFYLMPQTQMLWSQIRRARF